MFGLLRFARLFVLLCMASIIIYAVFLVFPNFMCKRVIKEKLMIKTERQLHTTKTLPGRQRKINNILRKQISKASLLGKWLLSSEGSLPPPITNKKKGSYLILIWTYGKFLERSFSPWKYCSVKGCTLSYRSKDLDVADAVIFHLHLTQSASTLPTRTQWNQKWIFLTDESPLHTFLHGNQELSDYNSLFNWSMTYRMDSDVPVPYGRTIGRSFIESPDINFSNDAIKKLKTKLVTVMGSNCAGINGRWNYINELKSVLGNNLDIFGKCLNGNMTLCPGHFDKDCPALNVYKFYLAFENSNCIEYITEKTFWHGYHKLAIPVIMGAPKKDCERLLPPHSFLHVSDFANPTVLANYIRYLHQHDDKYLEYHEWRKYYKVINEHGYFGSISQHYCRVCEALHYNTPNAKVYTDVQLFWNKERDCMI